MNRFRFTFFSLIFFFTFSSAFSQENNQKILDDLFKTHGEVYFTFSIFDRSEIGTLTKIISLDNVKGSEVFAYANRTEFGRFLELGYQYTILPSPGSLLQESELNMGGQKRKPGSTVVWNFYPTYDQYVSYMVGFAASHPDICRLDTIGTSNQGRLILAVKISDSVNVNRAKPEFFYTSSIHGDETTGYICMMHLIDSILSGYGSVQRITNLVNNYQIYINPLANPDGTYHGGNSTVNGAQRYNANYIDLNRNFPDPKGGPHPDGYAWQVETKAFMHYDSIHHFVMSANFHGGAEVINYPWDTWSRFHPDDNWMQFVSREYVDTVHLYAPAGYLTDLDNGITNGYAWYSIEGGRQDYTTYFHYGREMTMEISAVKLIPANQLLSFWNYNRRSFLNYIEESNYGINGQVTDTLTGAPLRARVFITGHDADNSYEFSNANHGWYFRPIAQGNWDLTFTCIGYVTKTVHAVNVTNRHTTSLNVRMVPVNYGIVEVKSKSSLLLYPNPSKGNFNIQIPESSAGNYPFVIYDLTGNQVHSGTIYGVGGQTPVSLDFTFLPKGIYLIKLTGNRGVCQGKIIIQ
ncbi:MAG: M14 family zinc carboxypeptidase [Bacteroidetes bacterium]|nr:M14 family zinc carboxypeptidase [Bacteroidota bacterium]